ncbi:MAG: hypothetical protein OEM38_09670 [Gammaproteobacteria bacterium]|nr:hypothetical protein [Gammaproteobacteria bacterium]
MGLSLLACNHEENTNSEVQLVKIEGIWQDICDITGDGKYRMETFKLSSDNPLSFSTRNYLDGMCLEIHSNEYLSKKSETFLLGESVTTNSRLNEKQQS